MDCCLALQVYGPSAWWWEVEELVRKLLLSAVVVLIQPGSPLQVTLAVLTCGWAHVLHGVYKPWGAGTVMYSLQHGSLFVTTFVFLMGLLFKVSATAALESPTQAQGSNVACGCGVKPVLLYSSTPGIMLWRRARSRPVFCLWLSQVNGVSTSSPSYAFLTVVMLLLCGAFLVAWVAVVVWQFVHTALNLRRGRGSRVGNERTDVGRVIRPKASASPSPEELTMVPAMQPAADAATEQVNVRSNAVAGSPLRVGTSAAEDRRQRGVEAVDGGDAQVAFMITNPLRGTTSSAPSSTQ